MHKRAEYLILFGILISALIVRIYISAIFYCTSPDEFANIFLARNTFESGFKAYPRLFMWFYYFISALLIHIVKDAFLATKLVTIIFGTASIALVYVIARRIFDKKIALLSSFLLFVNPEFTMISSTPLREPVYTFFILLAMLLLINKHTIGGAISIGMSFLTRAEGLLIGMPTYIVNILFVVRRKRVIWTLFVILIFMLFILFMNLWLEKPFVYLTQSLEHTGAVIGYAGNAPPLYKLFKANINMFRYLFGVIGLNIVFFLIGIYFFIKDKVDKNIKIIILTFFISHILFWLIYLYRFKLFPADYHRYLYPTIPFLVIFAAYGFHKLEQISMLKKIVISALIFNIVGGFIIYYFSNGRRYFNESHYNEWQVMASYWVEKNISQTTENKILADGIPFFYLFHAHNRYNLLKFETFITELGKEPEDLLSFISKNNIKYVIWTDEDRFCRKGAPYLGNAKEIRSEIGALKPIKMWKAGKFSCLIYKYFGYSDRTTI